MVGVGFNHAEAARGPGDRPPKVNIDLLFIAINVLTCFRFLDQQRLTCGYMALAIGACIVE